jgi:hypothetical protein
MEVLVSHSLACRCRAALIDRLSIFYCAFLAFEFAFLWRYMIETKGKNGPLSLEEIAALFDGDAQTVANTAQDHMDYNASNVMDVDDKKGDVYNEHVEHQHSLSR